MKKINKMNKIKLTKISIEKLAFANKVSLGRPPRPGPARPKQTKTLEKMSL